uniref:TSC22 domain family member 3 n=1 Tax=Ovis aries TaxID=9940 RepID=A0AC11CBD8_SHEEP
MGRQQATRWAARPHCLHVAEQATLARAPPDLRAAPRGAPYSSGRQLAWVGSASGASVVAIDNKIEQAMDLVKNHLMYAVREEVEILKEQIRELVEKNSQLERENTLLKTLASPEQLEKFQSRLSPEEPAPETPETPEAPGGSAV